MARARGPGLALLFTSATTALAGCSLGGHEGPPSTQPAKVEQAPAAAAPKPKAETKPETFSPAFRAKAKKLAKHALDGCDVKQAKKLIRYYVATNQKFKSEVFSDRHDHPIDSRFITKHEIIAAPLVLNCGSKTVGFAGIVHPEKMIKDPAFDPVRVINRYDPNWTLMDSPPSQVHLRDRTTLTLSISRHAVETGATSPLIPGFKSADAAAANGPGNFGSMYDSVLDSDAFPKVYAIPLPVKPDVSGNEANIS